MNVFAAIFIQFLCPCGTSRRQTITTAFMAMARAPKALRLICRQKKSQRENLWCAPFEFPKHTKPQGLPAAAGFQRTLGSRRSAVVVGASDAVPSIAAGDVWLSTLAAASIRRPNRQRRAHSAQRDNSLSVETTNRRLFLDRRSCGPLLLCKNYNWKECGGLAEELPLCRYARLSIPKL